MRSTDVNSAWSVSTFRLFLAARTIAWSGNAITMVAMPLLVFALTGSPGLTSLVAAVETVPYLVLGLPAGALADRWNRHTVMIVTSSVSAVAVASIPIAGVFGALSAAHALTVSAVTATSFVFFDSASFGAVPSLVGRSRLASAHAAMSSVNTIIGVVGPAVGGLLATALTPQYAIAVDAAGFAIAAALLAVTPIPAGNARRKDPDGVRNLRHEIREGLAYLWHHSVIRLLTVVGAAASVSAGAITGTLVIAAAGNLGLVDNDRRIGLLYAAMAAGAFLTTLVATHIQHYVPTGRITIGALAVSLVTALCWSRTTSFVLGVGILIVYQFAATLSIINSIVVRQTLTPDHLQSRVNTTARMIAISGTPVGAGLAGALAESFSIASSLLITSSALAVALAAAVLGRAWRIPALSRLVAITDIG